LKSKRNKRRKIKNISKDNISETISFYRDSDMFHLNNSDYFLAISELDTANGINITKNILIFSKKIEKKFGSYEAVISMLKKNKRLTGTHIAQKSWNTGYFIESSSKIKIISFFNTNLNPVRITNKLQVNSSKKGFHKGKFDLGQIIIVNDVLTPKELVNYYKVAIQTRMKYFEYLKLPEHIQNIVNDNEFLVVASIIPEVLINENKVNLSYVFDHYFEEILLQKKHNMDHENLGETIPQENYSNDPDKNDEVDIEKELIKTIVKSCNSCLKRANISFGILDYIIAEGVTIDALVDAGMELCVGVEDSLELRKKLKKQILKSLEDLNVIALLMSAIRCEEDFQSNRLREVDVSEDPAYLYTDEVLGIAIANQIAGTKATFNFKRYDEEKPGIIANLGPMVDDIFAGLVAGCMSKIFEEDY
jgi:alpha-ribazole phosphatase CobZ